MKRTATAEAAAPSKMVIVDSFTRLIFGDAGELGPEELRVVAALRAVEPDVAADEIAAIGQYLRALGVEEMIALVSRVQDCAAAYAAEEPGRHRARSRLR